MPGKGLEIIPLRIPSKWDPVWFEAFVRDTLSLADVRNAESGPGISVTGTPSEPATISGSVNVEELTDSNFVVAEATPLLANARVLDGEGAVVEIEDGGSGGIIRVKIAAHGITFSKFRLGAPCSVVGNPTNDTAEHTGIAALANDTVLCRTDDALGFASVSALLDFLGNTPGAILVRGATDWELLPPGVDGQVLTLAAGVPTWADLPAFAPADAAFVTSADETADLPNSRELVQGTDITLDTTTPGEIEINTP